MDNLESLTSNLRHKNTQKRADAIKALARSQDEEALKFLAWAYRNDADPNNRELAYKGGQYLRKQLRELEKDYPGYDTSNSYSDVPIYDVYAPHEKQQASLPDFDNGAALTAKVKKRQQTDTKQQTHTDTVLSFISTLLGAALFLAFIIPGVHWVEMSGLPMRNGTTFGQEINRVKQVLKPTANDLWLENVSAGLRGADIGGILGGRTLPAEGIFVTTNGIQFARETAGMQISYQAYYTDLNFIKQYFDLFAIIFPAFWIVVALTILTSSPAVYIQLKYRILFFIPQIIVRVVGLPIVWLTILTCSFFTAFVAVWFYFEAATFVPEVIAVMELDLAEGVKIGRELGIGYWIALGASILGVIVSGIGFMRVTLGKAK